MKQSIIRWLVAFGFTAFSHLFIFFIASMLIGCARKPSLSDRYYNQGQIIIQSHHLHTSMRNKVESKMDR